VEQAGGAFGLVIFPFFDCLDDHPLEDARRALRNWAAAAGVPCLDLLPACLEHRDEELMVNSAGAHPNERAHAIAATAIEGFLGDLGLPAGIR
jgi:hypothetical protein